MKCEKCGTQVVSNGTGETLVGYPIQVDESGYEHHHNDNCLKRYYTCKCGHSWIESKIRTCNIKTCNWTGKLKCFCHSGDKVKEWTDATR